jgi:hypothetical protein
MFKKRDHRRRECNASKPLEYLYPECAGMGKEWTKKTQGNERVVLYVTWCRVVMEPLVSAVAISERRTAGTLLAVPTPRPDCVWHK